MATRIGWCLPALTVIALIVFSSPAGAGSSCPTVAIPVCGPQIVPIASCGLPSPLFPPPPPIVSPVIVGPILEICAPSPVVHPINKGLRKVKAE